MSFAKAIVTAIISGAASDAAKTAVLEWYKYEQERARKYGERLEREHNAYERIRDQISDQLEPAQRVYVEFRRNEEGMPEIERISDVSADAELRKAPDDTGATVEKPGQGICYATSPDKTKEFLLRDNKGEVRTYKLDGDAGDDRPETDLRAEPSEDRNESTATPERQTSDQWGDGGLDRQDRNREQERTRDFDRYEINGRTA